MPRIRLARRRVSVAVVLVPPLLAVALVAATLPAVASSPTISLSPSSASAGTTVTVRGSGFPHGWTVQLAFDGSTAGMPSVSVSSSGSFSVGFTVKSGTSLGTHTVGAYHGSRLVASAHLSVIAAATATPTPTVRPSATPTATAATTPTPAPSASAIAPGTLPSFSHVYWIVMENKEYSSIVGSSSAPYINSLISKYGLATSYYAVSHPSEPNYLALFSGSTQGVTTDGTFNFSATNLADQLEAAGRTWHVYEQDYPGNCYTGSSYSGGVDLVGASGTYVRKHNPAISFTDISGNSTRCAKITNLASFNPAAASFEMIVPNLINDMHDGTIAQGDSFLKSFVPLITGSSAFANSALFITWDEGTTNTNGGGHVATLVIAPGMIAGTKAPAVFSHYSLLRTAEAAWGLPCLVNSCSTTAIADIAY